MRTYNANKKMKETTVVTITQYVRDTCTMKSTKSRGAPAAYSVVRSQALTICYLTGYEMRWTGDGIVFDEPFKCPPDHWDGGAARRNIFMSTRKYHLLSANGNNECKLKMHSCRMA